MTAPVRAPAPLVVARVLVVLQIVVAVVAAVAGGLLAASSAATAGGSPTWSGFGVVIGGGVLVVGLVAFVALGIPLLVLRGATPTRRVTGRGLLVLGEVLLFLPLVTATYLWAGPVLFRPVEPIGVLVDLALLTPLVVIGAVLMPTVGRWAEPDRAGARGVSSL